jgi:lipopolysaccharide/colanic/teichoic acid biosynthesis glycosyltransferase
LPTCAFAGTTILILFTLLTRESELQRFIGYRGAVSSAEALPARVVYDLSYIENWSLWFDLRIMLMTTWALVAGENAF